MLLIKKYYDGGISTFTYIVYRLRLGFEQPWESTTVISKNSIWWEKNLKGQYKRNVFI